MLLGLGCKLEVPDDPAVSRYPSCEVGQLVVHKPTGWGCVDAATLQIASVAEAKHAANADEVKQALHARHVTLAGNVTSTADVKVAIGFEGPPAAAVDVRGGVVRAQGSVVTTTLRRGALIGTELTAAPGERQVADLEDGSLVLERTQLVHFHGYGSVRANLSGTQTTYTGRCRLELGLTDSGGTFTPVASTTVSPLITSGSPQPDAPIGWFAENEASFGPGDYKVGLRLEAQQAGASCTVPVGASAFLHLTE
jgi:hypothetical protein